MPLDRSDRQALRSGKDKLTGEELEPSKRSTSTRRQTLATAGSILLGALAGCSSGGNSGKSTAEPDEEYTTTELGTGAAPGTETTTGGETATSTSSPTTDIASLYQQLSQYTASENLFGTADVFWRMYNPQSIIEKTGKLVQDSDMENRLLVNRENSKAAMVSTLEIDMGLGYDQEAVSQRLKENSMRETGETIDGFTIYNAPEIPLHGFNGDLWIAGEETKVKKLLQEHDNQPGFNPETQKLMTHDEVGGDAYQIRSKALPPEEYDHYFRGQRDTITENGEMINRAFYELRDGSVEEIKTRQDALVDGAFN